jgi:hypothetical protein
VKKFGPQPLQTPLTYGRSSPWLLHKVRFARLIHAARPRSWRTFGPRRLRRRSHADLIATLRGTAVSDGVALFALGWVGQVFPVGERERQDTLPAWPAAALGSDHPRWGVSGGVAGLVKTQDHGASALPGWLRRAAPGGGANPGPLAPSASSACSA